MGRLNPPKAQREKGRPSLLLVLLPLAFMVDVTLMPTWLQGWADTRFLEAVVILGGLRYGRGWGIALGWAAALLPAFFFTEPLGFALFRLAFAGMIAGYLQGLFRLKLPWLNALLLLALLLLHNLVSQFAALTLWQVPFHFPTLGFLLTLLGFALFYPLWMGILAEGASAAPARS